MVVRDVSWVIRLRRKLYLKGGTFGVCVGVCLPLVWETCAHVSVLQSTRDAKLSVTVKGGFAVAMRTSEFPSAMPQFASFEVSSADNTI